MEPPDFTDLSDDALVLVDSRPIIYVLEAHPKLGPRFRPLFEAHAAGRLRFAVTTISIAEVLAGPLQAGVAASQAGGCRAGCKCACRQRGGPCYARPRFLSRPVAAGDLLGRGPIGTTSLGIGDRNRWVELTKPMMGHGQYRLRLRLPPGFNNAT